MALAVSLDIANAFNQCIGAGHTDTTKCRCTCKGSWRTTCATSLSSTSDRPALSGKEPGAVFHRGLFWDRFCGTSLTRVVCYADETLVLVRGADHEEYIRRATCSL